MALIIQWILNLEDEPAPPAGPLTPIAIRGIGVSSSRAWLRWPW